MTDENNGQGDLIIHANTTFVVGLSDILHLRLETDTQMAPPSSQVFKFMHGGRKPSFFPLFIFRRMNCLRGQEEAFARTVALLGNFFLTSQRHVANLQEYPAGRERKSPFQFRFGTDPQRRITIIVKSWKTAHAHSRVRKKCGHEKKGRAMDPVLVMKRPHGTWFCLRIGGARTVFVKVGPEFRESCILLHG